MNQKKVIILVVVAVGLIILFFGVISAGCIYLGLRAHKELIATNSAYDFNGIVDSVSFENVDGPQPSETHPTVFINGKSYRLYYYGWPLGYKIHKGDTLIKHKNSLKIWLNKRNGKKYIFGH